MTELLTLAVSLTDALADAGANGVAWLTQNGEAVSSSAASLPGPAWVAEFLQSYGYIGIIGMLILCGLGLPIPEEVTLIGSGYLAYLAKVNGASHPNWIIASAVCVFGILLGDTVVYSLGRRFGNAVLKLPLIRHELTPNRLAKFDKLFARYGDRAIFFSRFFMGVRLASYFVAGRQRMPYWKFILLDLAGALLSGPTSVAFGYFFGDDLHRALDWAHKSNWFLLAAAATIIVGGIAWARWKHKRSSAPPPESLGP